MPWVHSTDGKQQVQELAKYSQGLPSEVWFGIKRERPTHISRSMLVKNLTFQMHQECMHWAHTHPGRQLHPRRPLQHICSNTVTTEHAPKPSTALSQSAAKKMLKQQLKWAWPLVSKATPENFLWLRGGDEEAVKKAPNSQPASCPHYSLLSSFSGDHIPVLGVQIGHAT